MRSNYIIIQTVNYGDGNLQVECTAIKFVVPKSFKACAFPMYKLGNAWEMNTCVQACMPLGYKHFQAFPRGIQAWTQVFISQAFT